MTEKKECPFLIVGGVHITDAKLCQVHEEMFRLREDTETKFQEFDIRLKAIEEKTK